MSEKIGVKVGHDAEAVTAARDAVIAILEARADQKTIRAALQAFTTSMSINGLTVRDCHVDMSENVHNHHSGPDEEPEMDDFSAT